jgi:hypothetical protein
MLQPAKRTAVDRHQHLGAGGLGQGQHERHAGALRAGKAGPLLRPVAVGEDRDFVVGGERALDGAEGVVHLGHHVGGQALVDHKAMESGKGSTVKSASGSRELFS